MVYSKNYKRAVIGITTALVLSTCTVPVYADSIYTDQDVAIAVGTTDATYMNGLDLAAQIITTVEQDQRSPYRNKGIAVVENYLEIYAQPDSSSEVVGKMYTGSGCDIQEISDGWAHIVSGECDGYVEAKYLLSGTDAEAYAIENELEDVIAKSQSEDAYLYQEPSADSAIVATVVWDEELTVLGSSDDGQWVRVRIGESEGYIPADSVILDVRYELAVAEGQPAPAAETEAPAETEAAPAAETPETERQTETAQAEETQEAQETEAAPSVSISDTDVRMWATYAVSIRSGYSTDSQRLGVLLSGESILVTGIADNGWSRVQYNGSDAYIKSEFLTSVEPVKEEETQEQQAEETQAEETQTETRNETVYATANVYVRAAGSTQASRIGALVEGESVTRTGEENGWSIVSFNGVTGYVKSDYLSTSKPETPAQEETDTAESSTSSSTADYTLTEVNETVYMTAGVNIRREPSTSSDVIGGLTAGSSIVRTANTNTGWSRVTYNGQTGYINRDYISTTPVSTSSETVYATATVNVRSSASASSSRLGVLQTAESVTRTGETNGWSIVSYNGQVGYVKSDYLSTSRPETTSQNDESTADTSSSSSETSSLSYTLTEVNETVYMTAGVNVRTEPSTSSAVIGTLSAGTSIVRTANTNTGWSRVTYNGQTGYINRDYISTSAPVTTSSSSTASSSSSSSSLGQQIANYALQFEGNPYVYGGNSLTNGVDCSGFTQQVYLHFGYSIPRRASIQATVGTSVSLSDVQPGDLIFYPDSEGVGHVAIYIGNNKVIHASTPSTGIIISNMYYRQPHSAKRII